jgi:ribonuclease HII
MKILGLDEAGRGPVLGALFVCGYMIDSGNKKELSSLGIKDSKLLSQKQREEFAPKLEKLSIDHIILKVPVKEVDFAVMNRSLNILEIEKMQKIINTLKPDVAIIDSPEVNTKKFAEKVRKGLFSDIELICENYADANHPEVSAASILAKIKRENEIARLHKKYGFFGSGYTSDERTITFLKDYLKRNKELPDIVRKSWVTTRNLLVENSQTKLV